MQEEQQQREPLHQRHSTPQQLHAAATVALANSSHPVLTSSDTDQHRSPGAAAHVAAATASPAAAGRRAGQGHSQHVAQEPDEPDDLPQQHAQEDAGAGGELSRPDGSDMEVDAATGQQAAPQQQVVVRRYKRANQQREKKRREKQKQRAMKQQQMAMMQEQQAVQSQEQQQCGQPGQDEQVPELSFCVWRQHSMQEQHELQHDVEFAQEMAAQEQQEAHFEKEMGPAQNDEVQDTQQQQQQPDRQVSMGNERVCWPDPVLPAGARLQAQLTANVLQQAAGADQPKQEAHGGLVTAERDRSGDDDGGANAGGDGSGEGAGQHARPQMHYDPAEADILLDKALQMMGAEVMDWLMETGAEALPRDGAVLLAFLMNPRNPVVTISGMKPGAIKEVLSIMPQQLTPVVVKAFHNAKARATGQGGAAASTPPFNRQRRQQQQGDTDEEGGVTAARDRRRRRSGRRSLQPSPSAKRLKKQQRQQEVQPEEPEACGVADSMQQDGVESAHEDEDVMLSKWYQREQGQKETQQEPREEQQQQDGAERGSPSHHFQRSSPPAKQQQQPDWSAAFRSWQDQGGGSNMEGEGLGASDDFGMSRQHHQYEQQHKQQEQQPAEGEEGHAREGFSAGQPEFHQFGDATPDHHKQQLLSQSKRQPAHPAAQQLLQRDSALAGLNTEPHSSVFGALAGWQLLTENSALEEDDSQPACACMPIGVPGGCDQ